MLVLKAKILLIASMCFPCEYLGLSMEEAGKKSYKWG